MHGWSHVLLTPQECSPQTDIFRFLLKILICDIPCLAVDSDFNGKFHNSVHTFGDCGTHWGPSIIIFKCIFWGYLLNLANS